MKEEKKESPIWLCIAKFVLHDHVHEREEAGHRIVDKVSAFLIYYSMIKAKCCRNLLTSFFFGKKTGGIASFL